MKIIEALKKVKANRQKMADLTALIRNNSANMESEKGKTPYSDPKAKVKEWLQSVESLQSDNAKLLANIQYTNLHTEVSIEMPSGTVVTKTVAEWIVRRREGVDSVSAAYESLRTNLKQNAVRDQEGNITVDHVILNFSAEQRDKKLMDLSQEKSLIDSKLEIVNATTDLIMEIN